MKKFLCVAACIVMMQVLSAQANPTSTLLDSVSNKVIHYLQVKQADSIYTLAGKDFKDKLPGNSFREIMEGQVFPLNNFQSVSFMKNTDGINKYKVTGSPELQLLVGLDNENMLQTFLIQPFSNN